MPEPPVAASDHAFRVVLVALDYCGDHHCGSEEEREVLDAADAAMETLATERAALLAERQQLRVLAKAARSQAAAPDYDEECIRELLWTLVDAALAGEEDAE